MADKLDTKSGCSVEEALLEVPNDKMLHQLLLHGATKDRSADQFRLAAYLGELGVRPEAAVTLIKFADSRWGKFSKRADWAERIAQLIAAYREKFQSHSSLASLRPMTMDQLKAETPEVEWAIEGLLAVATYGLITGATGVGKSTVAMQMGMVWSKGGDWNDYKFHKARILYGSHEMGPNEILYFTDKLQTTFTFGEEDVFHIIPAGQTISVLTQEGRDFYLQYVDDYDVFVFDTVSSSTHLPMLDERTAPGIVSFFADLNSLGKTVLALGHDTKDAAKQGILRAESMYGHRLLMDRSSLIMRLDQENLEDDEHVTMMFPKTRLSRKPKAAVYYKDPETLWLSRTTDEPFQSKRRKSTKQVLKDAGVEVEGNPFE